MAGNDEAPDPRAELQESAQQMAQELMRTADLPAKLGWTDFDFEVDLFDPYLDDLEGLLGSGQATKEMLSSLLGHSLDQHTALATRLKILKELERRVVNEIRLDVRQQAQTVIRALQHLSMPLASIGLIWQLYPKYMVNRVQERRKVLAAEEMDRTSEQSAIEDGLTAGKGTGADLKKFGEKALGSLERLIWGWVENPPKDPKLAQDLIAAIAAFPGRRAARSLVAIFYSDQRDALGAAARSALAAMPIDAREQIRHHLLLRDPEAKVRQAFYAVAAELKDSRMSPFMVEDALGAGPWSQPGEGVEHGAPILASIVKLGDRRAIPMLLHVMAARPPKAEVKAAVIAAFKGSPMGDEFEAGRRLVEEGKPIVVPRDMTQEEFLQKYGTFSRKMDQNKMQEEIRRVSLLWEECYHEEYGWKKPKEVLASVGPREKDLLKKLSVDVQQSIGRLAGHPQVAALESEFKTKWMTTPQNDVSGRIPLAIILEERQSSGADPEETKRERERESSELYAMACRSREAKMEDDAKRFAAAVLQLQPDHAFAKDFLDRVGRGEGIPGIDETSGGSSSEGPRIILPS